MTSIQVWAPLPTRVELDLGGTRIAMKQEGGGWWSASPEEIPHGARYGFALDDEGPFPDPRAGRMPDGVHALSGMVDHTAFTWRHAAWQPPPLSSGSIIYELHPGTFTPEGTFDAAGEKLEHLRALGVTHVELMPVNSFSGSRGWGYDGVCLYAPHEAYGGPDGLKRFVDRCHGAGLAVLLDVVYNHFGPEGNYLGKFAPYQTDRHRTVWGDAVNLDGPGSAEVRRFFIDNALMWLRDYRLDGLRIDAVHAFQDESAVHFLEQLRREVDRLADELGRHLVLIAESDLNDPRIVRPTALGGYGMHAQWSDDFHHCLHAALTGERSGYYADFGTVGQLAKAFRQAFVYDGCYCESRGRPHGVRPTGLDGRSFLAYIQNHDQVGNRARGERLTHLVSPGKARIAAALALTSPFIPMIFQGEEWAASAPFLYFTAHEDDALGRAVSEGRRREFSAFGWNPEDIPDPQDPETFRRSKLDWAERKHGPHREMLEWYGRLIALRRDRYDLRSPDLSTVETRHDGAEQWIAIRRGRHQVVANLSGTGRRVPLFADCGTRLLAASGTDTAAITDGTLTAGPESVAILGP